MIRKRWIKSKGETSTKIREGAIELQGEINRLRGRDQLEEEVQLEIETVQREEETERKRENQ